jgi:hypothetical protein
MDFSCSTRIYSLDIILPERGADGRVCVVDINGARSGYSAQRELYGDDRIEEKVIQAVSSERGIISSISHTSLPHIREKYSSENIRKSLQKHCGISWAHRAYVLIGSPTELGEEQNTRAISRRWGSNILDIT